MTSSELSDKEFRQIVEKQMEMLKPLILSRYKGLNNLINQMRLNSEHWGREHSKVVRGEEFKTIQSVPLRVSASLLDDLYELPEWRELCGSGLVYRTGDSEVTLTPDFYQAYSKKSEVLAWAHFTQFEAQILRLMLGVMREVLANDDRRESVRTWFVFGRDFLGLGKKLDTLGRQLSLA